VTQLWFSAAELVGLPGMPGTKRSINRLARWERWSSRTRQGRGGGREFAFCFLPPETREHLVYAAMRAGATEDGAEIPAAGQPTQQAVAGAPPRLRTSAANRAHAKLAVFTAANEYARASSLSRTQAWAVFCGLYNEGKIDVAPEVRQAVHAISPAALYRWQNIQRTHGPARLAGAYGNRRGQSLVDARPELMGLVIAMLVEHPHAHAGHILSAARARMPEADLPSRRSLERWMDAWKQANRQVYAAVTNPDGWKNNHMVAFGSRSEDVARLNQLWELDSTPADVMLTDGRHSIIGVIDVFTRRAHLLVSKTSRAVGIATLMRRALLDWGVPEVAKTDNGADYTSHHVTRVFSMLAVEHRLCAPFAAWEKPHIERFFHTFSHDLLELAVGFIGHNVAERETIRARQSFAERLFQRDAAVELHMSAAALQTYCDRWVTDVYHQREHTGLNGRTPFQAAAEWRQPVRRITDERALDILLAEAPGEGGWRVVTKKGLRIEGQRYIHSELGLYVGDRVRCLYDPEDIGRIHVFAEDGGFVCIAECPEITGVSRREVAIAARARQTAHVQAAKAELKRAARKVGTREIVGEILESQRLVNSRLVAFPAPSLPHQSEGLNAAADAARSGDAPVAAPPTPAEQRKHREFLDRFHTPKPAPPETPLERYKRWHSLDQSIRNNQEVTQQELAFHASYVQSAEYRAQRRIHQSFKRLGEAS